MSNIRESVLHTSWLLTTTLGLTSLCPGQSVNVNSAKRPPVVIAPGDTDLETLARQVGKFLGNTYDIEASERRLRPGSGRRRFRFQSPLILTRENAEAVLSRIAAAHDLRLIYTGEKTRQFANPDMWGGLAPRRLTPKQVLAPSTPEVVVQTTVRFASGIDAKKTAQTLRPFLGAENPGRGDVTMFPEGFPNGPFDQKGLLLIGRRGDVACALRLFKAAGGVSLEEPKVAARREAPRHIILKAGRHALGNAIDKIARLSGENHLYLPENLKDVHYDLPGPIEVTPNNARSVLARLTADMDVEVFPLDPTAGIYVWMTEEAAAKSSLRHRRYFVTLRQARRLAPLPMVVHTVIVLDPEKLTAATAFRSLRGTLAHDRKSALAFGRDPRLLFVRTKARTLVEILDVLKDAVAAN